jgi:hypothetical protein
MTKIKISLSSLMFIIARASEATSWQQKDRIVNHRREMQSREQSKTKIPNSQRQMRFEFCAFAWTDTDLPAPARFIASSDIKL